MQTSVWLRALHGALISKNFVRNASYTSPTLTKWGFFMTIYFCYLLEFSNRKFYVGMSRIDGKGRYDNRYARHAYDARRGKNNPVYQAWREHGAPTQTILSEHATREECAKAEVAYIALFDSQNPDIGYNVQRGGMGLHAPKGSRMWELMNERVWANPVVRKKLSAANKGFPPSPQALAAAQAPDVKARRHAAFKATWTDNRKAKASEQTRKQMTPEAREHLSVLFTGRDDPRTIEGKERQRQAAKRNMTPERVASMRAKAFENPENVAKFEAGRAAWRESEANAEHCKRIAKLAGEASKRRVKHVATGIVYESCQALAEAMGYSHQSYVSRLISQGKVVRL